MLKGMRPFGKNAVRFSYAREVVAITRNLFELPGNQSGKATINLNKVEKVLNKEHYGLTKVKRTYL